MELIFYASLFPLLISVALIILRPETAFARKALLMGIGSALLLEGISVIIHATITHKSSLLYEQPLGFMGMVSFLLIGIFTPSWSTRPSTFAGLSFLVVIAFLMLLTSEVATLFGLLAAGWCVLILMVRKRAGVLRLCVIYGALISGCFTIGVAYPPANFAGYLLLLGAFPLSAWYGHLFTHVSTGISASVMVIQCIAASKIAVFLPQTEVISHNILLGMALFSALMAAYQPVALRALSGLAASQLAFLAFCYILPYAGLEEARMFLTATVMLASPGLLLAIGALEARHGSLMLHRPQGNYDSYPRLANTILFFGLLSAGFPLSLGYVGEDLLFEICFHHEPAIIVGWLAVIGINAITAVKFFLFLCKGRAKLEQGIDLKPSKYIAACASIGFLFAAAAFLIY